MNTRQPKSIAAILGELRSMGIAPNGDEVLTPEDRSLWARISFAIYTKKEAALAVLDQYPARRVAPKKTRRTLPKPEIPLDDLEIPPRVRIYLQELGVKTIVGLAEMELGALNNCPSASADTIRALARICVTNGIPPKWLGGGRIQLHVAKEPPAGFVPLAGPYDPDSRSDRQLLEIAIAQLGDVRWKVVVAADGLTLYRSAVGYKPTTPED